MTALLRQPLAEVPEVPWSQFWPAFRAGGDEGYRCNPHEGADHVTIIGPTRTGKSSLAMHIAALRPYVTTFVEKPKDVGLAERLRRDRYVKRDILPEPFGSRRVYLWPPHKDGEPIAEQRRQFGDALRQGYRVGGWHFVVHEGQHLVEVLGLGPLLKSILRMGASNQCGLILATGRPAWMPRDIYSAASHMFIFGTNDDADLRSIGGMNGVNNKLARQVVANLGKTYRFLYVNTRTGTMLVSRAPKGLT